ncbi:MAG: glucose-6-phosphate isomerase, partial [Clostridiales bacterium]|nr:glucose-6-phosphate isomerase [Clostridiales bacterium]
KEENIKTFYIPEGVGGRFSELCPVGLLPAAVLNVDIKELLAGAKYMDKLCKEKDLYKNPALMSASLEYLHYNKGKVMSVMMPYSDALKYVADWYAQLWGESLGKEVDKNGNIVNVGSTPIKTLGVTDQHSQVQLYREGPFDKVITFLEVEEFRTETNIPHGLDNIKDVAFLSGHTMNELINIEKKATEYALTSSKRANSTIILPRINAFTVGELLYFFEMKTAFMGELLNIDTYNQPGVEGGKIATYALLGREGFSEEAKKLANINNKNEKYVI